MQINKKLTPEEFNKAKSSFDRDWGAPKSTRAVLGTYAHDPELFWKNFNKYYNEDEVVDLSGVAGFKPGDLGIPIKNRKKDNDPLWTVFNPAGIDFGDVAEHGDIIANLLGYAGVKVAAGAAATPGGPLAQIGAIAASELKASAGGQAAEAVYDQAVRGLADPYHGDLVDEGAGEYAKDRVVQGAVEAGAGTVFEGGYNAVKNIGSGFKKGLGWVGDKILPKLSPDHPTATKIDPDTGKEVPMSYAENIGHTRERLRNPPDITKTDEEWARDFDEVYTNADIMWKKGVFPPDGPPEIGHTRPNKAQQALRKHIMDLFDFRQAEADQWLNKWTADTTSPDEKMDMFKTMAQAQRNIFPIEIGLPSAGTVSNNRLIQLAEGFSNLFPLGHEIFQQSYHDMIKDIHKGMENVASSWMRGKPYYFARTPDEIREIVGNLGPTMKKVDPDDYGQYSDDEIGELLMGMDTVDQLDLIRDLQNMAANGYIEPVEEIAGYPFRDGTPAYWNDIAKQHKIDADAYDQSNVNKNSTLFRAGADVDPKITAADGRDRYISSQFFTPDIEPADMTSADIDRYLGRLEQGSPIASKDNIGKVARESLSLSHSNRMQIFNRGEKQIAYNVDIDFIPELATTTATFNDLAQEWKRIQPSGGDILGAAVKRADNIVKGLQPDWDMAENIIKQGFKTPERYADAGADEMWARATSIEIDDLADSLRVMREGLNSFDYVAFSEASDIPRPREFIDRLEEFVEQSGDPDMADMFHEFLDTIPTIDDQLREYKRLGEMLGISPVAQKIGDDMIIPFKEDDKLATQYLRDVRRALRQDISMNMRAGRYVEGVERNRGDDWINLDNVREKYLNEEYYPMLRDLINAKSDGQAYDLLFAKTKEGPNRLQTFMENLPFGAQNAIKAATFLRLGKQNPQNYDYADFDLRKFVRDWDAIPEANKEIMFGTQTGLKGSMDAFADQMRNLEHIEDRAGQGAVGQIVAATVIVGGVIGGLTGATFTGDLEATASGALTGSVAIPALTLGTSWGIGKLLTNKKIIDRIVDINKQAKTAGDKGKLKEFFGNVEGGFRMGLNRLVADAAEEGLGPEMEMAVDRILNGLKASAAEMDTMGWDRSKLDMSEPQNMQFLLEGMSDEQALELRTGMTPEDIMTLEEIYNASRGGQ